MDFILRLISTLDIYGIVGIAGSLLVCLCYFLGIHNYQKYAPNKISMLLTNLVAAALLSVSLIAHPNPGSILIEIFWSFVAIYGLIKNFKKRFTSSKRSV